MPGLGDVQSDSQGVYINIMVYLKNSSEESCNFYAMQGTPLRKWVFGFVSKIEHIFSGLIERNKERG